MLDFMREFVEAHAPGGGWGSGGRTCRLLEVVGAEAPEQRQEQVGDAAGGDLLEEASVAPGGVRA